jgi:hypothetical protein
VSHVELLTVLQAAFATPTVKQKEAYGRFAHTLAAAAVIGAVTIIFSEGGAWPSAGRVIGLMSTGVICFLTGTLLSKGE